MACTGVKDSKGELIWEGDLGVIRYKNENVFGLVTSDLENGIPGGFVFNVGYKNGLMQPFELSRCNLFEKLGNIYENPELMEE